MNPLIRICVFILFLLLAGSPLLAEDDIFARQGDVVLTQAELDAAFARVPEHIRMAVIRDGGKVDQMVQSLLRYKQIAIDASEHEFDQDPEVQARLRVASNQELAEAWLEKVVADAPAANYEAIAHERYLAHPEAFLTEEVVDVSHILVEINADRTDEEALELANSLRSRLLEDPAQFDALVEEYSDDPGKAANQGRYPQVTRGQMVAPFEETAFSLEEAGQLSSPVKTSFGYHVIRLNRKTPAGPVPFEQVKAQLMQEAREGHLSEYRKNYILNLSAEPIEIPEGAVETMLMRHFGENLELAPDVYNQ
jgi:peptidyl-prolyl cis-trans isomerase C